MLVKPVVGMDVWNGCTFEVKTSQSEGDEDTLSGGDNFLVMTTTVIIFMMSSLFMILIFQVILPRWPTNLLLTWDDGEDGQHEDDGRTARKKKKMKARDDGYLTDYDRWLQLNLIVRDGI